MKLGSRVRDTVTNFTGIATQRIEYLEGSPRVFVEAQLQQEVPQQASPGPKEAGAQVTVLHGIGGSELRQYWFDEARLVEA